MNRSIPLYRWRFRSTAESRWATTAGAPPAVRRTAEARAGLPAAARTRQRRGRAPAYRRRSRRCRAGRAARTGKFAGRLLAARRRVPRRAHDARRRPAPLRGRRANTELRRGGRRYVERGVGSAPASGGAHAATCSEGAVEKPDRLLPVLLVAVPGDERQVTGRSVSGEQHLQRRRPARVNVQSTSTTRRVSLLASGRLRPCCRGP
jgi:hypothetical protein